MEVNGGTGLAVGKNVTPDIKMRIPDGVHFTTEGPRYYDQFGKSSSLYKDNLREPQFHDWMKEFAENLKKTAGEKTVLPAGTQELLDAPYMDEANAALERYLRSKYTDDRTINPKLKTIMPDKEGRLHITYGDNQTGMVMRSSIDDNLIKSTSPVLSEITTGVSDAKIVARTAENSRAGELMAHAGMVQESKLPLLSNDAATAAQAVIRSSKQVGDDILEEGLEVASRVVGKRASRNCI